MKKIILDPGHDPAWPGSKGIIDEVKRVREIVRIAEAMLKAEKFNVLVVPDGLGGNSANENLIKKIEWISAHADVSDILISCHANSHPNSAMVGTEVWYPDGNDHLKTLAAKYSDFLSSITQSPNRGVFPDSQSRWGQLGILRHPKPAIKLLSENGFVTNPQDAVKGSGLYAEALHQFIHSITGVAHVASPRIPPPGEMTYQDKYERLRAELQRVLQEF